MLLRRLATVLILLGIVLLVFGWIKHRSNSRGLISDESAAEYSQAAEALHSASVGGEGGPSASEIEAARERFRAARDALQASRQRDQTLRWILNSGGFALILAGGLLHMALRPAAA